MKKTWFAAAGALLFAAGATAAQAQSKLSAGDKMFSDMVSQGNNAEVMMSRLALKKSSSKRVRTIAEMLVQQHGQAEEALKQVAAVDKFSLPPGTDEKHRMVYKKLEGLSGGDFDKAYIAALVPDHYTTIAAFNKEMTGGTDTQVRSFAAKYLPAIETHTQMITALASNYKIPVGRDAK